MTDYTTVYEIRDVDVIDGKEEYTMIMTTEKVDLPEVLKEVAIAAYRLTDEIFGIRYRVDLKPEYKGYMSRFDHPMREKNFMDDRRNKYFADLIIRKYNETK